MMMMMKRSIVLFAVIITMVNNMGLCFGTRVAHSVTLVPSNRCYIEEKLDIEIDSISNHMQLVSPAVGIVG
ncbi:hypothetical protein G4B88_007034 [Cannabis sativa]|uniref:Uncharacterized protein n=1 Tax=Cannabis sativa TaxID=3483 RepID=A0A7J6FR34_CANSA|nr:hypothetical protein G4B88_007034 [Cannabis sativa]